MTNSHIPLTGAITQQAKNLYLHLLTLWSDALVDLQVKDISSPGIHGGIMCPACCRIHGRSGEAIYPLLAMARHTGKARYLDAAMLLFDWSRHVSRADGSWVNEVAGQNQWKGTTVFGVIALGEAVRQHGMLLDETVYTRWLERFQQAADFAYDFINMSTGNINYPISNAAAMAIAGSLLNDARYTERARELAQECLLSFTKRDNLLFGEADQGNRSYVSAQGAYPVDLGYNVEESLPNFVLYAQIAQDEKMLKILAASLQSHLEFLLPDGAWDNSWGTRNYKWTYWGSRTADGCQAAYALMAMHDDRFAVAVQRNAELLLTCTHRGILYGGPHFHTQGEPCIHHTFCHAKSLALVLDYALTTECMANNLPSPILLPREEAYGVRMFPDIRTWLVAVGPWRATVTANDWESASQGHASGGSLSLLWHRRAGPLLAAGMTKYRAVEPDNMTPPLGTEAPSLVPHLHLMSAGQTYTSINDLSAHVRCVSQDGNAQFYVTGRLVDEQQMGPGKEDVNYHMEYCFTEQSVEIRVSVHGSLPPGVLRFLLPIISAQGETNRRKDAWTWEISKPDGRIQINSSVSWELEEDEPQRQFNPVPGFECLPFNIPITQPDVMVVITLTAQ